MGISPLIIIKTHPFLERINSSSSPSSLWHLQTAQEQQQPGLGWPWAVKLLPGFAQILPQRRLGQGGEPRTSSSPAISPLSPSGGLSRAGSFTGHFSLYF